MRRQDSTLTKSSLAAAPEALITLVRLLARQAARELAGTAPAPPDSVGPKDRT
jgi:hypothetical protein